jgi:antibiotic biosynthesis monooxygenase (ABM) superfamily enzyme
MSASDEFFFKLEVAAAYNELKNIPGFPEQDAEVDQAVAELTGELKEIGAACSFDLDDETLAAWIKSQQLNY